MNEWMNELLFEELLNSHAVLLAITSSLLVLRYKTWRTDWRSVNNETKQGRIRLAQLLPTWNPFC